MKKLTHIQAQVLEMIKAYQRECGFPPTRIEIADAFGWKSRNAAETHLRALQSKGVLFIRPGTSRGLTLVDAEVK